MTVKILVVDDSTTMRKIIQMTFAAEDAQVETANGLDAALAKLDSFAPDLVFADLSMSPDGYEVAKTVKSRRPSTAVIALSSQHAVYDVAKGGACGVDDNIVKPFDTASVIDRVAQVLARPRVPATTMTLAGVPPAAAAAAAARPPLTAPGSSAAIPLAASPRDMKRTMAFGMPLSPVANPVGPVQGAASVPGTTTMPTMQLPGAMPSPNIAAPSAPLAPAAPAPVVPKPAAATLVAPVAPAPNPAAPAAPTAAPAPAPVVPKPVSVAAPAPVVPKPVAAPTPSPAPAAASGVAAVAGAVASAALSNKLAGLGLTKDQVEGVLALSREVIEQVVWEVVPELAEALIKEEIKRLTAG